MGQWRSGHDVLWTEGQKVGQIKEASLLSSAHLPLLLYWDVTWDLFQRELGPLPALQTQSGP